MRTAGAAFNSPEKAALGRLAERSPAARKAVAVGGTVMSAARALHGDVTAMAKLGGAAAKRLWRSKAVRWAVLIGGSAATVGIVSMCGVLGTPPQHAAAAPIGVSGPMWSAYRSAVSVQCNSDGDIAVTDEWLGPRWNRADPVLVAAVGMLESAHGTAVRTNPEFPEFEPAVDAFGAFAGPIRSAPLYDPADFHSGLDDDPKISTVWDSDGGRWDGNPWVDHAVGPTQVLPSFAASWGVDGDGDGVVHPHSTWDATATTAAFFCVNSFDMTRVEMLKAYSNDDEYVALVAGVYPELAETWGGLPALELPGGAPLVRDPQAQARWGWTVGEPRLADPLLAALLDSVGDAGLEGGGLGIADGDVACGGDLCLWSGAKVPAEAVEEWQTLHRNGLGAPLFTPNGDAILVSGLLPETGWTIAWPVASAAGLPAQQLPYPTFPPSRSTVAFPVPLSPWPATPVDAPDRLNWHITADDPVWGDTSTPEGALSLPTPVGGVEVYSPIAGRISGSGGCASVTGAAGWSWGVCGISPTSSTLIAGGSDGWTGQRIGFTAASSLRITLADPTGIKACPQAVTRRWSSYAASPTSSWPTRSPDQIVQTVLVLWDAAEDINLHPTVRAEAEIAAEELVVDLFESCMPAADLPSPFRDRR